MHKKVNCGDLHLFLLHNLVIRFIIVFIVYWALSWLISELECPYVLLLSFLNSLCLGESIWLLSVMQFYVDTVRQMALRQLVAGSPLRTLCLLIAGQPAEVFSADISVNEHPGAVNLPQQHAQVISIG